MKLIKTLLGILALSGIVGCANERMPQISENTIEGTVEPLVSSKRWEHLVIFVAQSTGCTDDKSFELQIDKVETNRVSVSIIRTKPDYCRRSPMFEEFQLTLPQELNEVELVVNNPLAKPLN
ncbi:hypothetical protein [Vibrio nigripulchritudo]|uniref:hypothetical protein n=1 Tax=Vibrio nigripulchritudo TaxID=28173 RepID=UPI0005FA785E|nr:hypothetical protein [Vibrio nigripulchritudo]KJY80028.1 hypothetical protein TW74_06635 [Vibrio nigripulchritudo]